MMTRLDAMDPPARRSGGIATTFGWCLAALVVAVGMSFAANILVVDVLDAAIDPFTGGAVVPDPVTAVLTSLLVGGSTGAVVGSRVPRRSIVAACAVIATYLFVWPLSFMPVISGAWLPVGIVAHFVFAAAAAHLMSTHNGAKSADSARVS